MYTTVDHSDNNEWSRYKYRWRCDKRQTYDDEENIILRQIQKKK